MGLVRPVCAPSLTKKYFVSPDTHIQHDSKITIENRKINNLIRKILREHLPGETPDPQDADR